MSYRLSVKADNDFKAIYKYTYINFSERLADKYTESFEGCSSLLSKNPSIGRVASHIKQGLCRHEHQEHLIFYKKRKSDIFIVRIPHNSVNVPRVFLNTN